MQAGGYDSLVDCATSTADAGLTRAEQAQRDRLEAYYDTKLDIFRRLLGDGMLPRLVISSDAGPFDCEFGRMHYGLRLAVDGGMSHAAGDRGRDAGCRRSVSVSTTWSARSKPAKRRTCAGGRRSAGRHRTYGGRPGGVHRRPAHRIARARHAAPGCPRTRPRRGRKGLTHGTYRTGRGSRRGAVQRRAALGRAPARAWPFRMSPT